MWCFVFVVMYMTCSYGACCVLCCVWFVWLCCCRPAIASGLPRCDDCEFVFALLCVAALIYIHFGVDVVIAFDVVVCRCAYLWCACCVVMYVFL